MATLQPTNTATRAPTGATPANLPTLPGTGVPVAPIPPADPADPAQFVNSDGQIQQQVKDAADKAALQVTQTAVAVTKNENFAKLLKDDLFADIYYEIVARRDEHAHLADESLNPGTTTWHRAVHGVIAAKLSEVVDVLQAMPAAN